MANQRTGRNRRRKRKPAASVSGQNARERNRNRSVDIVEEVIQRELAAEVSRETAMAKQEDLQEKIIREAVQEPEEIIQEPEEIQPSEMEANAEDVQEFVAKSGPESAEIPHVSEAEQMAGGAELSEPEMESKPKELPEPEMESKPKELPEPEAVREPEKDSGRSHRGGKSARRRRRRKLNRVFRRAKRLWKFFRKPVTVLLGIWMVYLLFTGYCVKSQMTVEVGDKCPKAVKFLRIGIGKASFVSDIDEDTVFDSVGDYYVIVRAFGKYTASVVHVKDTVAPEVKAKDAMVQVGGSIEPEAFIAEIKDRSKTVVSFAEKPDCSREATVSVTILVKDEGGNVTEAKVKLQVVDDSEPPVISGVEDITIAAGSNVSYKKGVTVTDNRDGEVTLTVDTSKVDTNKVGDYEVIYTAVDAAGNVATARATLHVTAPTLDTVTEEVINAKADELLSFILKDGMSDYDKAKTIYWWCHNNIAYSDGASKNNWVQGAYQGIVNRKGDCYTYAASAKCLLTRAGITNMDIERIPSGNSMHYWNLIDIGEGWHHFDTCRRADGSTFFYKTDAEIKQYSDSHNGTHNYDRSKYPQIP